MSRYLYYVDDWQKDAACGGEGDRFFPAGGGRPRKELAEQCQTCPVQTQCLNTALESPWRPYGTWGGKTAAELIPLWESQNKSQNKSPEDRLRLLGLS